jgi:purine-binding chemotaxis protein CheW
MQMLIFNLENQKYGLITEFVKLIEKPSKITPIPKAPEYAKGVINLRGKIVSIIDIKNILELQKTKEEENFIILNINEESFGISVDSVEEVIDVSEDSFEKELGKDLIKYNDDVITILQESDFMKAFGYSAN